MTDKKIPPTTPVGLIVRRAKPGKSYTHAALISTQGTPFVGIGASADEAAVASFQHLLDWYAERLREAASHGSVTEDTLKRIEHLVRDTSAEVLKLHATVLDEQSELSILAEILGEQEATPTSKDNNVQIAEEDLL